MEEKDSTQKEKSNSLEHFKAISVFLSSVVIAFAGTLLTSWYNANELEISRTKDITTLVPKLQDPVPNVRLQTVAELSLYGKNAVHPLISAWRNSDDGALNSEISNSIYVIGNDAIPELLKVYKNPWEDAVKREWALQTLFVMKYDKSEQLVREALFDQGVYRDVLRCAVMGAGDFKLKDLAPRIIQIINVFKEDSAYSDVVRNSVHALILLGDRNAVGDLVGLLNHPDQEVRIWVVDAIGALGDKNDVPILRKVISSDQDPAVRREAVYNSDMIQLKND